MLCWWLALLMVLCVAGSSEAAPKVICEDAGAGGYQAFPDVTRLSNGDLLCTVYAGYGHVSVPTEKLPRGGRIMAIRSRDNGETWGAAQTVIDTPMDDRDPHASQLADGAVMVSFFTRLPNGYVDVYAVTSHSLGEHWGAPVLVARGMACSAKVRELKDGTLVLPVYGPRDGKAGKEWDNALVRSTDHGATWSAPIPFPTNSGHSHDETDVIELPGGKLLAMMRPCMCRSFSTDGGLTWSDTEPVGFVGYAPCLLRTSKGILLMGHREPNTALHYSFDDGATWHGPVPIDGVWGAYPGLAELPDGRILCVYYEEGEGSAIRQQILTADRTGVRVAAQPAG